MKKYIAFLSIILGLSANAQITTLAAGAVAPDFKLKGVDGKEISFSSFPDAKGFIVVFTCNTCPVAQAYAQRIVDLNNKYASLGYPVIAINPNDPEVSAGDDLKNMKDFAKAKGFTFPYLYDPGQIATNLYGARNTPHVFIISKTSTGNIIQYTGSIDNDPHETNADRTKYIEEVITSLSNNTKPAFTLTKAIGCTVARKKSKK